MTVRLKGKKKGRGSEIKTKRIYIPIPSECLHTASSMKVVSSASQPHGNALQNVVWKPKQ